MFLFTSFRIVYRAVTQFSNHGGTQMGAALAYYALFSIAPLLMLAVMFAGLFFDEQTAREEVRAHLTRTIGPEVAREVTTWMQHVTRPSTTTGTWTLVAGIGLLVLGGLGVFLHLRSCLSIIWKLEPPAGSSLLMTLLNYLLAIIAVLCMGLLLLVSLAATTAMAALVDFMDQHLPGGGVLWYWLEVGLSFLLLTLFFAVVYWVMSSRGISWGYIAYGALITALLFTLGKTVIGLYLAYSTTTSVYGAASSLVVFLIWVYYSSQIVFFGAELIQVRRTRHEWMAAKAT